MQALGTELVTAMEVRHERQGVQARALSEEALARIAVMNEAQGDQEFVGSRQKRKARPADIRGWSRPLTGRKSSG
jgi:hypothetical protein